MNVWEYDASVNSEFGNKVVAWKWPLIFPARLHFNAATKSV